MRLPLHPVLLAAFACAPAWAQTSSVVPDSAEEALKILRRTQAAESDWSAFPDRSSVHFKVRTRRGSAAPVDGEATIFLDRKPNGTAELQLIVRARSHYGPASFDRPELDASNARLLRHENIMAAGRRFTASVYEIQTRKETPEFDLLARHVYWLAPGVPAGVVRKESEGVDSGRIVRPGGSSTTVLTDLDVPFIVQGKTLRTYCYNTTTDLPDGEREQTRYCKHASVPGGIVRMEQRKLKNGVDVYSETMELEEFDAQPNGGAAQAGANFGCTAPSLLMSDVAAAKMRKGDFKGAIADYNAMIGVDPGCAVAFNNRGFARMRLGNTGGATTDFDRAIALQPRYTQPYVNRAVLKLNAGDLQSAHADLNQALEINPNDFDALVNRMVARMRLFQDERAMEDYALALKLEPTQRDGIDRVLERTRAQRKR